MTTTTLRAAAGRLALPLRGARPWWGRPQAVLLLLEHGDQTAILGTVDAPLVDDRLGPAVAELLGLPAAAVLLVPSGARPGPLLDAESAAPIVATAAALAETLRPARLFPLHGHRWKLSRLEDAAASTWGARQERRPSELEKSRPDAALARIVAARNGQDPAPGLPWVEGLVDAGIGGLVVEDCDTEKILAVFAALRSSLPAPASSHRPSSGPLAHARAEAARRLWRKQRGASPVVALTAAVSADSVLQVGGAPPAARSLAADLGRAVADAALESASGNVLPVPQLTGARAPLQPAGASVRDGAGQLPQAPAAPGPRQRSLPGALGTLLAPALEGHAQALQLGPLRLLALPGQLTTGLAQRIQDNTVLMGPSGGHLGAFCTAREHDRSRLQSLAPWGRESGRWLVEQQLGSAPLVGRLQAQSAHEPPTAKGRQPVLRLRRHTPGKGAPTELRVEVEWVGAPVEVAGPWLQLHREDEPLRWEGALVNDLEQDMMLESRPHADTVQWRLRWSLPLPRRWSGRLLSAELPPWGLRSEARKVP